MSSPVKSSELVHLDVGNVVAIRMPYKGGGALHWILGSVKSLYPNTDIELRLWEKWREPLRESEIPNTTEAQELLNRLRDARQETQKHIKATNTLINQLRGCRAELISRFQAANGLVLKSKAAIQATSKDVERIRDLNWNELRSYRNPPKTVLLIVRAVMLLLSEDEARTWPQMRRIIQDSSFRHRILFFDAERQLSPNRCDYILQECISRKEFNHEGMLKASVALSPIYYWILAQLDYRDALTQKEGIEQANHQHEEYLALLNELNQEEAHVAKLQMDEDKLVPQLRFYCMQNMASGSGVESTHLRESSDDIATHRYNHSFAGKARHAYLLPAFYQWMPTDRVTFVPWKDVLTDFGSILPKAETGEGYFLPEFQIRALNDALTKGLHKSTTPDSNPISEFIEGSISPFPRPTNVTDRFQHRIKGNRWKNLLAHKRSEIEQAFRVDTANCLRIPIECITVADLRLGSLIVDLDIEHDGSRKRGEIQQRINTFGYPTVMKIYKDNNEVAGVSKAVARNATTEDDPSRHTVKLDGKLWSELLLKHPTPLTSNLHRDISEAMLVEQDKVKIIDVQSNEKEHLTVNYNISDHNINAAEVDRVCEAYAFPHTWAFYRRLTDIRGGVPVVLSPDEVPLPLNANKDTNEMFVQKDTPIEVMRRRGKGQVSSLNESEHPLPAKDGKVSAASSVYRAAPKDMLLHSPVTNNGGETVYVKNFEGNYWSAAFNTARLALTEAFRTDTASALGMLSREIEIHSFTHTSSRLQAQFSVPPRGISPRSVSSKIDAFEYPEVWSLYNQVVYNQKTPVGHFKQVFNGEDWSLMLLNKRKELEETFMRDVCEAIGPSPVDVSVHNITADRHCAVIHYKVNSEGDLAHDVDHTLKDYPFPNIWALYRNRRENIVQASNAQGTSAALRENDNLSKIFEGDAWDEVLLRYRAKVEDAFKVDQSACLSTQTENILIHSAEASLHGLKIVYGLKGVQNTRLEVEKSSNAYHYPEIWALYEASWVVTHHRVVFEGENWGRILEGCEPQFEAVFATCTAELFHLKTRHVQNTEFTTGSLIVEFDLNHPRSLTTEEIDKGLMECPYDPLWAMYREQVSGSTEQLVATIHTLTFEGEHWGEVIKAQGPRLYEAVQLDSSEALGLPKESIEDVRMDLKNSMLRGQFTVYHPASQTDINIDNALSSWSYERVWGLYMVAFPNSTAQLPPAVPFPSFDTEHLQTSPQPRKPMGESRDNFYRDGVSLGEATFITGGAKYVRSMNKLQSNSAWRTLTGDSLIEPGNQYCNGSSTKVQSYFDSSANEKGFTTAVTASSPRARSEVVVGVTQRGSSSTVRDTRDPDKLVCCFEGKNLNIWLDKSPSYGQTTLFIDFIVIFQGKGWDYVIRNRYSLLKDTFCEEVYRTLVSIAKNTICETNFAMDMDQNMIARFRLPKVAVGGLTESDIRTRLNSYPYRKVWALYDDPATADATMNEGDSLTSTHIVSMHNLGFEAPNWELIDWLRHDEIVAVVRRDTARAVRLHMDDVDVNEVNLYLNLLHIRIRLRHSTTVSSAELKERMLQHDYAEVWRLYEEVPEGGQESGVLVKVFEGDQWGPVVSSSSASLAEAFCTGISRCLQIPRVCVTVVNLTVGSLVVEYTVRSNLSEAAIRERTATYSHPEVWSFYQYSHVGNVVSLDLGLTTNSKTLQRTFEGNIWDVLACRRCGVLQNLFIRETSHALGIPHHQIHVKSLDFVVDKFVVNYCANLTGISDKTAEKLAKKAKYSELWSLYRSHDYRNFEKTQHKLQLKGKNWGLLLEYNFQLLVNTFALCTIKTLNLERWCIDALGVELKPHGDCLEFSFTLCHPTTMSASKIDRTLRKCNYNEIWAFHDCNPTNRIRTSLSVHFSGVFWQNAPGAKWPELREAFIKDVANAFGMPRTEVTEAHMERVKDGIYFSTQVAHSPVLSARLLQSVLDRNDFPEIYSIYFMRHHPKHVDYVTSNHRVDFEADRWPEVMKHRREQAFNSLRIDAAAALSLTLEDVNILFMNTIESRLSCSVAITHPETQTVDEIQGKLNEFSYIHIWALYEDAVQPRVDVLKARYVDSTPTALAEANQEEMPSQDFVRRIRNSFIEDTSIALKLAPHEVIIDGIQLGRLMVHYHLAGHEKHTEVAALRKNCQYPNSSALLNSHELQVVNTPPAHASN